MKTKYFFVLLVACLMGTQVVDAQNREQGNGRKHSHKRMTMEQMADMQATKIVEDLGLDDKTAAKFTEVYKRYMKEQDNIRKEFFEDFKKQNKVEKGKEGTDVRKPMQPPTNDQVDKMMRDRFKQSRKMIDIREKYYNEFRKFLSPKQAQKVFDQGQMNRGMFNKEMNRRAGMKQMNGSRRDIPGGPDHQK